MPAWLIQFLVNLAIQFGLPWLIKVFPWAKQFQDILNKLILDIENAANKKDVVIAKFQAKQAVREQTFKGKYGVPLQSKDFKPLPKDHLANK